MAKTHFFKRASSAGKGPLSNRMAGMTSCGKKVWVSSVLSEAETVQGNRIEITENNSKTTCRLCKPDTSKDRVPTRLGR